MNLNLQYSTEAKRDLNEIWEYILIDSGDEKTAFQVTDGIAERAEQLTEFPLSGAALTSVIDVDTSLRFLVSGKYIIFYECDHNIINIVRILHTKRDYMQILFG